MLKVCDFTLVEQLTKSIGVCLKHMCVLSYSQIHFVIENAFK